MRNRRTFKTMVAGHVLAGGVLGLLTTASLTGCGAGLVANGASPVIPAGVSGKLFGGATPISGAAVSLMAAGTTGYGSTPALLSATVSASDGSFTLPGHVCPTPDSLVYIQSLGGNPGTSTANSAINLIDVIGNCSTATASTRVTVNEATTIAGAYALAQFASVSATGTGIGTSSTNITGLNNAAHPAALLVNPTTGVPNPTDAFAGIVLPQQVVDTLADAVAACANSTGAASSTCTKLFNATAVNGIKPVDTLQASFNLALHPAANVSAIFGLVSGSAPFQPAISSSTPPGDFTLAIGFNGGGIGARGTNALKIDSRGNAWISSYYTDAAGSVSGLIEVTPSGQFPGGATGFGNGVVEPTNGLAIDQNGQIWLAMNGGTPEVAAFTPAGQLYTQPFTGIPSPNGIGVDSAGNIWVSAGGDGYNQLSEVVNLGGGSYATGAGTTLPVHFGVDVCPTTSFIYAVSRGNSSESAQVTQYTSANNTQKTSIPDSGYANLAGCAVDNFANIYLSDSGNFNGVEVYNSGGTLLRTYAINNPIYSQEVVLDGLGNVFTATYIPQGSAAYNSKVANPASVVEFSAAGSLLSPVLGYAPITGQSSTSYGTGYVGLTSQIVAPEGMAIDASGNLWLSGNDGQSVPAFGNQNTSNLPAFVTEIIGIAAPVTTPLSVALTNGKLATRP